MLSQMGAFLLLQSGNGKALKTCNKAVIKCCEELYGNSSMKKHWHEEKYSGITCEMRVAFDKIHQVAEFSVCALLEEASKVGHAATTLICLFLNTADYKL